MVHGQFATVTRNVYPKTAASTSALSILRNGVRNTFSNVTPTSSLIDFVNSAKVAGDIAKNQLSQLPWNDAVAATRSLLSGQSSSGGLLSGGSSSRGPSSVGSSPVVSAPAVSPSQPQTFDYLDAPWASAYQMSKETAYSEALHNTSYQRAVKDMQKAGLNPAVIFGAGNGNVAGVPAYVSSPSSGSRASGRPGSGHSSSSRKSSEKLFSSSAYSVMSALGGIVGALATHSAGGYWIGTSLTQGAMSALSLLSKGVKRR